MPKFEKLTGVAAPLPMINVDTDTIIPKQFLKTTKRTGLGKALFFEWRYTNEGKEIPEFVLNKPQWRDALILVAGANFGCGSSREHAVWALIDYGIRCVIAPSFADIFFNNCFKNGLLPVVLPKEQVEKVLDVITRQPTRLTVDLEAEHVRGPEGMTYSFAVNPFRRQCLLKGMDDISLIEQYMEDIEAFERKRRAAQPWA